jgi:hypothetical protein
LDLELAPNTADVWQLWGNQNIGLAQLRSSQELLCAAWKWHDDSRIQFERGPVYGGSLDGIYEAVDTADAVVTWNGDKFDIPHLNREFLEHGYSRPKPFESIDLLKTSRKVFNFPSNKLDYVANRLLGVGKMPHQGHQLWVDVMAGDEAAWQIMEEYNRKDVYITERVYDRFLPWILKYPNLRLYDEHEGCPRCGSDRLQKRGFKSTSVSRFQQYQCQACKSWSYDTKRVHASTMC